MELSSEQGFIVYFTSPHIDGKMTSTAFKDARKAHTVVHNQFDPQTGGGSASYSDFKRYWQFETAEGKFIGLIPDSYILSILKIETVGPASADQSK